MNEEEKKKQRENESSKKAAGVATKGMIDYFTGGQGGKVYDAAKKVPGVGKKIDQAEDKLGKGLNQVTGGQFGKVAKKADDVGALQAADNVLSMNPKGIRSSDRSGNASRSPSNHNNVGRKNLDRNSGIATPATTPLNEDKKKNENHLQEQLKKNAVRAVANVFAPNIGAKVTDTLSDMEKKKKSKNDEKANNLDEKENNDQKNSLVGEIDFKKLLPILLPAMSVFLVLIVVISVVLSGFAKFQNLIGVGSSGVAADVSGASGGDKKLEDLYQRIFTIQQEYAANGKSFSADLVSAVYHILTERVPSFNAMKMDDTVIRELADYMFIENCSDSTCSYTYSESSFKEKLTNQFFPKYMRRDVCEAATTEVFQYIKDFQNMVGSSGADNNSGNGVCTYEIPGFVIGNSVRPVNLSISNLQFRPLQTPQFGGVRGAALDNGSLVDFEKYVLGVAWGEYAEGNSEAEKAMLVAARSYALARPYSMGFADGRKLAQENGQWVLALQNSVMDQVYCDPDQGCSRDVNSGQNSQLYSGTTTGPYVYKPALGGDAALRVYANQVNGVVLTDANGNVISTSYNSTIQKDFGRLGQSGLDYVAILLSHYSKYGATGVKKMNCSSGTSGDSYASWKQKDSRWANVPIGNSTIGEIGCLATSIAMLIQKSGVTTTVTGEFTPGSFVQAMTSVGGFDHNLLQWAKVNQIANNFTYVDKMTLDGKSKEEKLAILSGLYSQGYYMVCEVKGGDGRHWVAIDRIEGENIVMMDPGSNSTNMWSQYNWNNTSIVGYYKVS